MDGQTIRIGFVQRAHGVGGALKVQPLGSDPARFMPLKSVTVERGGVFAEYAVTEVQVRAQTVYLALEGVGDRNAAERLRGAYICVPRAEAVRLPADTYFICDLVGCRVTDTSGQDWGVITDVLQTGANDVYVVQGQKELLVPALKRVLRSVDIDGKHILLDAKVLAEVALTDDAL